MSRVVRAATPDDLPAVTVLYGREVTGGTATFELEPPSLDQMAARHAAVVGHGLPWLVDRWLDVTLMQLDLDPTGAPPRSQGLDLSGNLS